MISVQLPDGSGRELREGATAGDLAADIGPGLARAAVAARVNDRLVDLSSELADGDTVALVTDRDPDGLEVIRHSAAHLLAQAVKQLYPEAQVTIGPVVEDGFYYDFSYPPGFHPEDLEAIERRMKELARADLPITREVVTRERAIELFRDMGEAYKMEIIEALPAGEEISLYRQGDFVDLCRGPHVPATGRIRAFKLMKLAGAYWRGNAGNEMLQRVYGTAWRDKRDLKAYLKRLEEAERRDHRRVGRALDLFHTQDEAPGMIFWHDKGWTLYREVEEHIRRTLRAGGYREVRTPMLADRSLWERSGHWEKFRDDMFTTESEKRTFAVKPMNCPCHVQIFNQGLKSYRDLPLRMAEFGSCHRNEPSGTLHGLMRVRAFTQDDAHIFCTEAQIQDEVSAFIDMLYRVYADFGFTDVIVKLSTRPEQRVGSDDVWDKAEHALERALNARGMAWDLQPGEGAFYGPKIEFSLRDCLGRVWQCGTIQVDFSMPGRLGAQYTDENDERRAPVMLHRAILGSLERFIGILIEHYEGRFPFWLAPTQVAVCNITDDQAEYAREVTARMRAAGFRVETDLRNEKVGYKVRAHTLARVPYIVIVGGREREEGAVSVRDRGGEDLGAMGVEAWIARMREMNESCR